MIPAIGTGGKRLVVGALGGMTTMRRNPWLRVGRLIQGWCGLTDLLQRLAVIFEGMTKRNAGRAGWETEFKDMPS
jgi:hypothetical protein